MSQVQATLGITRDATTTLNGETVGTMDSLEKLARQLGADTKFSASEAADAINNLAISEQPLSSIHYSSNHQPLTFVPLIFRYFTASGRISLPSTRWVVRKPT